MGRPRRAALGRCRRRAGPFLPGSGAAALVAVLIVALLSAIGGIGSARATPAADGESGWVPRLPAGTTATRSTPWTDSSGADHRQRDAARRALERTGGSGTAEGTGRVNRAGGAEGAGGAGEAGEAGEAGALSPTVGDAEAMRRQGVRERDARRARGAIAAPPLPATPRIGSDAPPHSAPPRPVPPRIPIPAPGEPGGPPIALPTCGPAGCFDANGRHWPSVGAPGPGSPGLMIGPGGRPCVRIGDAVSC